MIRMICYLTPIRVINYYYHIMLFLITKRKATCILTFVCILKLSEAFEPETDCSFGIFRKVLYTYPK